MSLLISIGNEGYSFMIKWFMHNEEPLIVWINVLNPKVCSYGKYNVIVYNLF